MNVNKPFLNPHFKNYCNEIKELTLILVFFTAVFFFFGCHTMNPPKLVGQVSHDAPIMAAKETIPFQKAQKL